VNDAGKNKVEFYKENEFIEFKKIFLEFEKQIERSIENLSQGNGDNLLWVTTESSWLTFFLMTLEKVYPDSSFITEASLYTQDKKHLGRSDLFCALMDQGLKKYLLVEAKFSEIKTINAWLDKDKINSYLNNIDKQQLSNYQNIISVKFGLEFKKLIFIAEWFRTKEAFDEAIHRFDELEESGAVHAAKLVRFSELGAILIFKFV